MTSIGAGNVDEYHLVIEKSGGMGVSEKSEANSSRRALTENSLHRATIWGCAAHYYYCETRPQSSENHWATGKSVLGENAFGRGRSRRALCVVCAFNRKITGRY